MLYTFLSRFYRIYNKVIKCWTSSSNCITSRFFTSLSFGIFGGVSWIHPVTNWQNDKVSVYARMPLTIKRNDHLELGFRGMVEPHFNALVMNILKVATAARNMLGEI